MALTAAGSRLLVLNAGSDTLTSFDTQTFSELWRTRLSEEPEALIIGADQNTAFVTHARTGSLSVISSQTGQIRNKVRLEVDPVDGVMAEDGRFLFLIGRYATELLVLDVASLQTAERIYLGEGATVIAFDRRKHLLYVGKDNGEIAVVDPRALIAVDNYILESIPIEAIAIDEEENALFVLQPANKSLIKIDLVSKEELGHIELEEGSHSVVVMGER
jgi:DNA-binding beta-propeller fold protein YncE